MALITTLWIYDTITLLILLLSIFYYYMTKTFTHWSDKSIAHVHPFPILGNYLPVFSFQQSPGQLFQSIHNATKEKLIGFWIFRRPFLLIRDPDLIKTILIRDFPNFNERCHADCTQSDPIGCNNLFNMRNPYWRAMRIKLTPIFTSGKLKVMFPLFRDVGTQLNDHINTESKEVMEMKNVCAKFTTDVISSLAFGVEANSFKKKTSEFYEAATAFTKFSVFRSLELTSFFFAPLFVSCLGFKFFGPKATELFRNVFGEAVKFRKDTHFKRSDLVDLLIKIQEEDISIKDDQVVDGVDLGCIKFDVDTLAAQSAIFFIAGFESGSSGMSLCLHHLSFRPDWQKRIRLEIRELLQESNGEITYDILDNITFLNMCIKETLRMYPPLPFLDRECSKDYQIPGTNITIEKGTPVVVSLYGLQNDPKYFPNPETFDPERWNDKNLENITPYSYMPFGEGPRNCIGKRFALIQLRVGLLYILKDFEVSRIDNSPEQITLDPKGLLTTPSQKIQLKLRKVINE